MEDVTMTTTPSAETTPAPESTPAPVAPVAEVLSAVDTTAVDAGEQQPQQKKLKVNRRDKQRKTALCKHFDKPGGCPFPNCRFAHDRAELPVDESSLALAAQRKFLREQVKNRSEERFKSDADDSTTIYARRGTMIERYYTQLFACDVMGKPQEDQYVHMHSNRLCVVGAALSHPLMREQITAVEFTSHVLGSKVSGKKKRGGEFLTPQTILCHVRCASGAVFALRSCVRGTLLEVNERVASDPTLLQRKPESDGYLIILQPKTNEVMGIQESLLSKEEYAQYREAHPATATTAEPATATITATATETETETPIEPETEVVEMTE